jgi:hypothetical protein
VSEVLEEAMQSYLNTIIYISDRRLPINAATLHYLTQRVRGAFSHELGNKDFSLQPDENRNLVLTLIN